MKSLLVSTLAAASACLYASAAPAKEPGFPAESAPTSISASDATVEATAPTPACCEIPALTPVELEFVDPASSRTAKAGEIVALQLAEPLVIDGRTIASRGAKAVAEVIQASKAGMMGKAGELTFAARYIEIANAHVPLKRFGYGRSQGSDPSGTLTAINVATAAVLPIASVALIFVSGGNVDIKTGARAHAVVATATHVPSNP